MSICPWCKGKMPQANDVCPSCGKNPHEHPSISAGNFGTFEAFDDFDEPADGALDVAGSVEPLAAQGGPDVFGGDFDDVGVAPLEIEVAAMPVRAPVAAPPVAPQQASGPPQGLQPPTNYRDSNQQPSGPPSDEPAFDPYEIAVLADYGPIPQKIWEYPSYTVRVTTRKRDLSRRLAVARRSIDDAERQRDEKLADLADRLRPELEASKEYDSLLVTLKQIEATASERNEALEVRNQEKDQKIAIVDREMAGHEKSAAEVKARVDSAAAALDAARGEFERANAAYKRVEIELRNAQELARAAAGPQARTAPPEHAAKLQNLMQILEERKAAIAEPKAAFDEAKRVWNDAHAALKTVERQISGLKKQRSQIEQSYAKELGMRSQGVQQAQTEYRSALVAIGARLIELNPPIVPRELRQAFFESQEVLSSRTNEAGRLNQAIVSADGNAVKKGWMVILGGGGVALLLLVALIALLGRAETDKHQDEFPEFSAGERR